MREQAGGGARRARRRSPSATPARSPSSTARAWARRWPSSPRSTSSLGRAGSYAALRFSTDTADPASGALLQQVQERETAIADDAAVLRARVGGARDERAEELLGGRGPRLLPPPPAQRAPLPRAPAERARGADPHREGAHGRGRVDAAVRGADLGDRGRAAAARLATSSPSRSTSRSAACRGRSRRPPHAPPRRSRGARAGPAHARVPVQHAARRQGDRRPPAPLPALAGGAQPRQRGQRRVGAGADRGGPRAL